MNFTVSIGIFLHLISNTVAVIAAEAYKSRLALLCISDRKRKTPLLRVTSAKKDQQKYARYPEVRHMLTPVSNSTQPAAFLELLSRVMHPYLPKPAIQAPSATEFYLSANCSG